MSMKILFPLGMCMFLSSIGTSIPNVALPHLAKVFHSTLPEIQWVVISYLFSNTISIVLVGKLGDMFGRQRMLLFGIGLYSLSALLCGLSSSFSTLILGRLLQGIAGATLMSLSVALAGELIPQAKMGRAMGVLGTASAVGTASGPTMGGLILATCEWSGIFFLMCFIGVVIFIMSSNFLSAKSQTTKKILFQFPRLNYLYNNLIMNICVSAVMMTTLVVGPFYLVQNLNLNEISVGLAMSVGPAMSIASGIPSGRLVDRFGPTVVMKWGLSQILMGVLSFSFLHQVLGLAGYVISAALISPGYQMFQAANNLSVMANVSSDDRGAISGVLSLSRNIGLILGASLMGQLYSSFGIKTAFLAASILVTLALAFSFKVKYHVEHDRKIL